MGIVLYAVFGVILLAVILSVITLMRQKPRPASAGQYDVFMVSGGQLTVLSGVPATYDISDIARVQFSVRKTRGHNHYIGVMKIIKKNGKKSRSYMFDASVAKKKLVVSSSVQDLRESIQILMEELRSHGIPCSRAA